MTVRSVGVEEELLLVEPQTGRALAVAESVMQAVHPAAEAEECLDYELQRQQLETNTEPCAALDDLGREVRRCRAAAAGAAARAGAAGAALATSPTAVQPKVVGMGRYQQITDTFGLTAQEQLTCGCHVHVEIGSPDEGVAVLDRVGPWLAALLALSGNSPFWQDTDSSYASYRYQVWGRWPSSGPTGAFGSARAYRETIAAMLSTSTVLDSGMVYFDARLSERYPTIEIRICDVCLYAEDAVLMAALCRALVETAAREWRAGTPAPDARTEVLRLAAWRASRSGLQDELINPVTWRPEPAAAVADALLRHTGDALADAGDADTVADLLAAVLRRGNGAQFQRDAYRRSGNLAEVVSGAVAATAG
jgi:glutamate---cysteine ligase / carboxylate-amine ligase